MYKIDTGTKVYGSQGEELGKVDEIFADPDGELIGFLVKRGTLLTHDVRVPVDWVDRAEAGRIVLNRPAAEAEALSYDVEDSTL